MTRHVSILTALLVLALASPELADAQSKRRRKGKQRKPPAEQTEPKREAPGKDKDKGNKTQVLDFTGLQLGGRLRTPQLLYFLDRVDEELERASLEKRSFIPEMTSSLEEEGL